MTNEIPVAAYDGLCSADHVHPSGPCHLPPEEMEPFTVYDEEGNVIHSDAAAPEETSSLFLTKPFESYTVTDGASVSCFCCWAFCWCVWKIIQRRSVLMANVVAQFFSIIGPSVDPPANMQELIPVSAHGDLSVSCWWSAPSGSLVRWPRPLSTGGDSNMALVILIVLADLSLQLSYAAVCRVPSCTSGALRHFRFASLHQV